MSRTNGYSLCVHPARSPQQQNVFSVTALVTFSISFFCSLPFLHPRVQPNLHRAAVANTSEDESSKMEKTRIWMTPRSRPSLHIHGVRIAGDRSGGGGMKALESVDWSGGEGLRNDGGLWVQYISRDSSLPQFISPCSRAFPLAVHLSLPFFYICVNLLHTNPLSAPQLSNHSLDQKEGYERENGTGTKKERTPLYYFDGVCGRRAADVLQSCCRRAAARPEIIGFWSAFCATRNNSLRSRFLSASNHYLLVHRKRSSFYYSFAYSILVRQSQLIFLLLTLADLKENPAALWDRDLMQREDSAYAGSVLRPLALVAISLQWRAANSERHLVFERLTSTYAGRRNGTVQ
ncbi:hypothetical protein R3P38DRAFT_2786737 [Favolaschia claudopus]|uniref:Uncharacterized protein n=1 Tax=Favolaschia claudopus TaxID=2862362 RepID=A0AAW0AR40_9AGAR